MTNEFYTVFDVAKILGLHPQTIRNAIKNKRIIAFRGGYGKRSPLRISKEEIGRIQVMNLEATIINLKSIEKD